MYRADTIVACATPPGRGAVSIVRVSGIDAFAVADAVARPRTTQSPVAWKLHLSVLADHEGRPIDDALVVRMPGPRTYTGEDVVEIQSHGSPVIVEAIVHACIAAGARAADRGEFSRRAVLNGRMDLAQAEAVADLIDARATAGARSAWKQLQGALSDRLATIRTAIIAVLADVEANVDFTDDELPAENVSARVGMVEHARADIDSLLATFEVGRRQREGVRVVMLGPTNAGKSSLVNALLGEDRMIVSDEAGTTRDSVRETVDVCGIALVLTDTAGLRETPSKAETAAVARSHSEAAAADLVVVVFDGSRAFAEDDNAVLETLRGYRGLVAINKGDLPAVWNDADRATVASLDWPIVSTSAVTGRGCEDLRNLLREFAGTAEAELSEPVVLSRVRHRTGLEQARERLEAATQLLSDRRSSDPLNLTDRSNFADLADLAALELRSALDALSGVTDPLGSEEVLDRVFAEFCIGK